VRLLAQTERLLAVGQKLISKIFREILLGPCVALGDVLNFNGVAFQARLLLAKCCACDVAVVRNLVCDRNLESGLQLGDGDAEVLGDGESHFARNREDCFLAGQGHGRKIRRRGSFRQRRQR
jgi:hypothetical protein